MADQETCIKTMLAGLLRLPGYIDDVARRMIMLAALAGESKTVECVYGDVILHARHDSTVGSIRAQFVRQCWDNRPALAKTFKSAAC